MGGSKEFKTNFDLVVFITMLVGWHTRTNMQTTFTLFDSNIGPYCPWSLNSSFMGHIYPGLRTFSYCFLHTETSIFESTADVY